MKVLFITNIPSPYRVDFFNELGKYCDLTVCFERKCASDRNAKWIGDAPQNYEEVYLDLKPVGTSESMGNAIAKYVKNNPSDFVVFSGYSSPSIISAIFYCRRHNIRYFIEYDGGFNKKDPFYKRILKKYLISGASGHFITCGELYDYLSCLGVNKEKIFFYPFTSVKKQDIIEKLPTIQEKAALKKQFGISEETVIVSVGQFIYRKGFDILLNAASKIDPKVGIYIVGGTPSEEYLSIKESLALDNIHFVNFMPKNELKKWYLAADLFVFPTRSDIWGLVINEAMSCGLPIVSTDHCIAAIELVENGENGYIVQSDNMEALAEKINSVLSDKQKRLYMAEKSLEKIAYYTIENMVKHHIDVMKTMQ